MSTKKGGSRNIPFEVPTDIEEEFFKKKDHLYFMDYKTHNMQEDMSKRKGRVFTYNMNKLAQENPKVAEMKMVGITEKFLADTHMHLQPIVKHPVYTRRITGVSNTKVSF